MAITAISGVVGGLLGWGLVTYSASLAANAGNMRSAPIILPGTIVAIAGTLCGIGLFAGTLPAIRF